jgi:mRNA-degrading endonuclease YafQ of YafQ-DinJ toxin-antitoxin module
MFYLLSKIMKDYRPSRILELGIGETTKFISTFIESEYSKEEKEKAYHRAIEHDENFSKIFKKSSNKVNFFEDTEIIHMTNILAPIRATNKREKFITTNSYQGITDCGVKMQINLIYI